MEEKRICTICKVIKPFSGFNFDKRFQIPFSRCKPCYNNVCKKYRKSKQGQKTYKKWAYSHEGKISREQAMKKWRELNKFKRKAHTAVSNALRDEKLFKEPCSVCGNPKSEAHHQSYLEENWLKVIWLCKKHHSEITWSQFKEDFSDNGCRQSTFL